MPREESPSEKLAWRDAVAAVWSRPPVTKAVGVDIAVTKTTSLAAMLKPVIDGLEPYLGREPLGRGTLRPRDEQVTWLRISRVRGLPVGLRVRAGDAPPPGADRIRRGISGVTLPGLRWLRATRADRQPPSSRLRPMHPCRPGGQLPA